ncbi:MAG: cytidylate kinase-like family protein [Bacteroidales bacterium]|jgi:cytidylate kinase|nr:cytidylate kinase-like family protein [Bacteroidales bacterium]
MKTSDPLIITISRQMGSGGSYIGQKLAKKLKIHYADREIIRKAAETLSVPEEDLESMDEKSQTWWDYIQLSSRYATEIYIPPVQKFAPTDLELFKAECEIIKQIAKETSAVIIGRCGFCVLDGHPNLIKIFLHGEKDFRVKRIMDLYSVSIKTAEKMVEDSDRKRGLYIKKFSKKDWMNIDNYHLSVDTSKIGIDSSLELISAFVINARK